ncbi:hypothetical protein BDQ17DRAFT_1429047 [Cyathus striatus]|nr:hypothetical protein BDQ17DRAFT_1429047 [Cyathus striatus]
MANGLHDYVQGHITHPGNTEPRTQHNWDANDAAAKSIIGGSLDVSEQKFINILKSSQHIWDALVKHHTNEGPLCQAQLFLQVLFIRAQKGGSLVNVLETIDDLISYAWEMGEMTADLFKCITFLITLGTDFSYIHSMITHDIGKCTKTEPYTMDNLCTYINEEQRHLEHDNQPLPNPFSSSPFPNSSTTALVSQPV